MADQGSAERLDADSLINRMRAAYAAVEDYQAFVVATDFNEGRPSEPEEFLYSFKKPKRIRLDFETPHRGAVLVYPDKKGEVLVKLPGVEGILPLHLPPDSPRLMMGGQRIDQTDMGLLIDNIARSLTHERAGSLTITETAQFLDVRVLALNHFAKDVITLYRFIIDKTLWLPIAVEQSNPHGVPQRTVKFEHLKINPGLSDQFMEGG